MTVLILASCSDDLPKASWDICQVSSFNATAQDEKVLLEWAPMQGANPTGYWSIGHRKLLHTKVVLQSWMQRLPHIL